MGGVSVILTQVLFGDLLGAFAPEFEIILGAMVVYAVMTLPHRIVTAETFSQSREAPMLAAMASTTLEATNSRNLTMLILRSADPTVSRVLREVRRKILLGERLDSAVSSTTSTLTSYSLVNAMNKIVALHPISIEESEHESLGLLSSFNLEQETKLPVFTVVCFFVPILMLLYAAFSHLDDPRGMIELVGLQVLVVDIAYYLSSSSQGGRP
jgi:hypothetical protein